MLRIIIVSIAILTFACANNISTSQSSPASTPATISEGSEKKLTSFDGQKAFAHVKAQVDFGPRPAG
ncbi:MAG: hypothetical protein J2P41_20780, partial [Blastocatellia bacterium]|nr:hypothetical protein [Blastocatellia bacterium]